MSHSDLMQQSINALSSSLNEVLQYSSADLVRDEALGQLNFKEEQQTFENIFKLFREVHDSDLHLLPIATIDEIRQHAVSAVSFSVGFRV